MTIPTTIIGAASIASDIRQAVILFSPLVVDIYIITKL